MPDYRFAEIAYNAHRTYLDEHSTAPPSAVLFSALPARAKDAWLAASAAVLTMAGALLVTTAEEQSKPEQAQVAAAGAAV